MTAVLLAFAAGVLATLWLPVLPPLWGYAPPALALLLLAAGHRRWPRGRMPALVLIAGLAGSGWAVWQAERQLALVGAPFEPAHQLTVTGTVVSLPEMRDARARFDLQVVSVAEAERPLAPGDRLRVSWFGAPQLIRPGQLWRLDLEVEAPRTRHNPGGFDSEGWRFRQGLRASARVRGEAQLLASGPGGLSAWRGRIGERVSAALGDHPQEPIIRALVIGDRGGMRPATWGVLTATGTNHLMAISGLHVGLVAGLVLLLGRGLWRLWPAATLVLPAQRAAIFPALLAAATYALLAGFSIPTQRALIMLAVALLAVWQGWLGTPWRVLALALAAVLMIDPLAALAPGTWLSFAAVAWIVYSLGGRLQTPGKVASLVAVQWRLALGLAPLTLLFFDTVAWAGVLANLVAVPLFGVLVVPLALSGTLLLGMWEPGGALLLQLAATLVNGLWPLLAWLASLSQQLPEWPAPSTWRIALLVLALLIMLGPGALPGRWCALALMLVALWLPKGLPGGVLAVTFPDLAPGGQAVIVRSANATLVYDTGPPAWVGPHGGGRELAAMLTASQAGVRQMVVSHAGPEASGGWSRLVPLLAGEFVWWGGQAPWQPAGTRACVAGMRRRPGDMHLRVLHPPPGWDRPGTAAACVVEVALDDGPVLLLAGELGEAGQRWLLRTGQHARADAVVMYGEALDGPLARLLACQHRLLPPPRPGPGALTWHLAGSAPPQHYASVPGGRRLWHQLPTR